MSVPVFIGDEVSASGYRLAGLRVRVPAADELLAAVTAACDDASLVLLGAGVAQQLPAAQLEQLLASVSPPVVVVPDVRGHSRLADLPTRLRQQLGVLE
jgi:vacuolar-type H+-ATPase subunit F/Vma7